MYPRRQLLRKQQAILRRDWEQSQRRRQRERQGKERASLKLQQDFDLQRKLAELDHRREHQHCERIERGPAPDLIDEPIELGLLPQSLG